VIGRLRIGVQFQVSAGLAIQFSGSYLAYRTDVAAGHLVRSSKDYSSIVISSRTRRHFRGRSLSDQYRSMPIRC
jgi:hypothetical protein